jgi:chromosome partitioning protein
MRIIALITGKGGVGKSTLSSNIAVAAMEAGEKVFAIDVDNQGTLAGWGQLRQVDMPSVAHLPPEDHASDELTAVLNAAREKNFTVAIVDTPGEDSPFTHNAMTLADLCLVPLRPTRPDGMGMKRTIEALMIGKKRFAFILNQCSPSHSTRANEMAAGLISLGFLAEPLICQRADFQDAFAAGQGVTEYDSNGKAAVEIRKLWSWIDRETKSKKAAA